MVNFIAAFTGLALALVTIPGASAAYYTPSGELVINGRQGYCMDRHRENNNIYDHPCHGSK